MKTATIAKTNNYARSKIRTAHPGMDGIDVMTHFSHRQHAHHNTWTDVNSVDPKIFMAQLVIMELVQKSKIDYNWST